MQTLGAYLIFLLVFGAVGLAIIVSAMITLAISEGIAWMKSRSEFRLWERSVISFSKQGRTRANASSIDALCQAIRVQLFHVNQWMKQPL